MKKVYMITVGGSIQNANLEVHSVQFVYAENIEDTYPILKERWYGSSLHLDGYKVLDKIDGYEVDLNGKIDENLYLVVYGGYQKDIIDELHDYTFVIAKDEKEAKHLAKAKISNFNNMNHVDEIVDVFKNEGSTQTI